MNYENKKLEKFRPPDILLILGTDASGKNYVANFIADTVEKAGFEIEKRDGGFSKEPSDVVSSEDKSWFSLIKEKMFLATFNLTKFMVMPLMAFLIKKDLKNFRKSDLTTIVISNTPLRILSFYLGHKFDNIDQIKIPDYMDDALKSIARIGAKTIILDIDDTVRKKRIAIRLESGKADYFDLYMAEDAVRSERIENFLVWIGKKYLNAIVIENNDLNETELFDRISEAFKEFEKNEISA
ncbi:hypothetical protein QUF76_07935 [Desulfobacterales bacterium HSG16]|nr:hypothetical protein [Desulfobacterales bacterium HSG16]